MSEIREKVYKRLKLFTDGMNSIKKEKFLQTLGTSVSELKSMSDDDLESFHSVLMQKSVTKYVIDEDTFKGYIISKPENPRNVRDISFKINGWNPGDRYDN